MKTVIDLDPVAHVIGNVQWTNGNRDSESITRLHCRDFVNSVLAEAQCTEYVMFVQGVGHKNFRNEILPEYKGHRPPPSEGMKRWKSVIIDEFEKMGAIVLMQIESDDAVSILGHKYLKEKILIIANDKDIDQVPGIHYNHIKKERKTISAPEAYRSLILQAITGDPGDMPGEQCGIQGVGPAKAKKLLDKTKMDVWLAAVSQEYMMKYGVAKGLRRMALTYDMVKMLHKPDERYEESMSIPDIPFTKYVKKTPEIESAPPRDGLFD